MSHRSVYQAVSSVVPCAHIEWENGSAPEMPWATYDGDSDAVWAGDEQIAVRHKWTVELYEKRRDAAVEKELGDAIRAAFGGYDRRESYISSEKCLMVAYDFEEIEGDFDG